MATTARKRAQIIERGPGLFREKTWVVTRREPTLDQRYLGRLLEARDRLQEAGFGRGTVQWETGIICVGQFSLGDARGEVRMALGPDLSFSVVVKARFDYWASDVRRAERFACWVLAPVLEFGDRLEELRPAADEGADWECRVRARATDMEDVVRMLSPLFVVS